MRSRRLSRPTRVGDLLGAALPREPGGRGALIGIVRAWPEAVGDAVAHHAWPARMSGRELVVHAESSVWVTELQLLGEMVCERLRRAAGGDLPETIRFQVGPVPQRRADPQPPPPDVGEGVRREARSLAAPIRDDALRSSAERAIAGALAREQSR